MGQHVVCEGRPGHCGAVVDGECRGGLREAALLGHLIITPAMTGGHHTFIKKLCDEFTKDYSNWHLGLACEFHLYTFYIQDRLLVGALSTCRTLYIRIDSIPSPTKSLH